VYEGIDELTKAGDDFPARLYVTARTGFLPWEVIAINYVWSSNQTIGTGWMSPYTKKSFMVAVQTGSAQTGEWTAQRRNIVEDFKTFFNTDITELVGYALQTIQTNPAVILRSGALDSVSCTRKSAASHGRARQDCRYRYYAILKLRSRSLFPRNGFFADSTSSACRTR